VLRDQQIVVADLTNHCRGVSVHDYLTQRVFGTNWFAWIHRNRV
jgi:hypothetical protein